MVSEIPIERKTVKILFENMYRVTIDSNILIKYCHISTKCRFYETEKYRKKFCPGDTSNPNYYFALKNERNEFSKQLVLMLFNLRNLYINWYDMCKLDWLEWVLFNFHTYYVHGCSILYPRCLMCRCLQCHILKLFSTKMNLYIKKMLTAVVIRICYIKPAVAVRNFPFVSMDNQITNNG